MSLRKLLDPMRTVISERMVVLDEDTNPDGELMYVAIDIKSGIVSDLTVKVAQSFIDSELFRQMEHVRDLQRRYYLGERALLQTCQVEEKKLDRMLEDAKKLLERDPVLSYEKQGS